MSMTKNVYDIPLLSTWETLQDIFDYVDDLAEFIAEKTGLVVRDDLAITSPSYAPYAHFAFLAPAADADPYFVIGNNSHGTYNYAAGLFFIVPAIYGGGEWVPKKYIQNRSDVNDTEVERWQSECCIALKTGGLQDTYKIVLQVNDFNDGRKALFFKTYTRSTGTVYSFGTNASMYIGPIKMNGDVVTACLIQAFGINGSYLSYYEQPPYNGDITAAEPCIAANNWLSNAGMFAPYVGKECLIELDMLIAPTASIHGFLFSNSGNAELGRSVVIDGTRYIILFTHTGLDFFVFVIPEEVS